MSMSEPVVIRCRENGPYVILGDVKIVDHQGNVHMPPAGGKTGVALCRCGASRTKPFCDGSHRDCGFAAAETAPAREAEKSE
jgi:CDGSH-type Zn-finger protein